MRTFNGVEEDEALSEVWLLAMLNVAVKSCELIDQRPRPDFYWKPSLKVGLPCPSRLGRGLGSECADEPTADGALESGRSGVIRAAVWG